MDTIQVPLAQLEPMRFTEFQQQWQELAHAVSSRIRGEGLQVPVSF